MAVRRIVLSTVITLVLAGLARPAEASHTGLYYGAPRRLVVTMSEWKFTPNRIVVEGDEPIALVLENKGSIAHVFMAYTPTRQTSRTAGDWWEYVLRNTYFQEIGEVMVHVKDQFIVSGSRIAEVALEPGKTVILTFTPKRKGTFEVGCHLTSGGGSHYRFGMLAQLIVK